MVVRRLIAHILVEVALGRKLSAIPTLSRNLKKKNKKMKRKLKISKKRRSSGYKSSSSSSSSSDDDAQDDGCCDLKISSNNSIKLSVVQDNNNLSDFRTSNMPIKILGKPLQNRKQVVNGEGISAVVAATVFLINNIKKQQPQKKP